MIDVKTFDDIQKIECDEYKSACVLDLMLIREGFMLADGYALLIGADCKHHLKLYFLSFDDFRKFSDAEKESMNKRYGCRYC